MNNLKPRNPLQQIKYRFLEWQWDRILKKSGHHHWESYQRYTDIDFYAPGYTVKDQLVGYPYINVVPYQHLDCNVDPMWGPLWSGSTVNEWCKKHCRHKYRWHWERVIMDYNGHYLPNGIGGTDELFFGFKDERDYLLFVLRWG